MNWRTNADEREQGFTLIELLVVIIIIGILAGIAIPVFLNQRKKAGAAAVKSDLRQVATAMTAAAVETGGFPGAVPADVKISNGVSVTVAGSAGPTRADFDAFVSWCAARCTVYGNGDVDVNMGAGWGWRYLSTGLSSTTSTHVSQALTVIGYTGPAFIVNGGSTGAASTTACVSAVHASDPATTWKWDSATGAIAKGIC